MYYTAELWKYRYSNTYDDYEKCKQVIHDYSAQMNEIESLLHQYEQQLLDLNKKVEELTMDNDLLVQETTVSQELIDALTQDNDALQKKLKDCQDELQKYITNYYVVIQALKKTEQQQH